MTMSKEGQAADLASGILHSGKGRMWEIGGFLAGCGIFLVGIAAVILALRMPTRSSYDRLMDDAVQRGLNLFEEARRGDLGATSHDSGAIERRGDRTATTSGSN